MGSDNKHSQNLVDIWGDYIDWKGRRKGENGFLIENLQKNNSKKIFNSALGDGSDSVYLLKNGFDVTNNEIDDNFLKKALENARINNVELNVTRFDWRRLSNNLEKESFDAVICMGNSLVYLPRKKDRIKALKEFYKILKPDGVLLIDERNHQYIKENKEEILKGNFRYSRKYVYTGKHVDGFPIYISKRKFKMKYVDSRTGKFGIIDSLYLYKENELKTELKEAGFTNIQSYSDYKKHFDREADFYQYFAVKKE